MAERQEKEIHLLDYWHVVLKRRWVVYTSLAVVVSVTTLGSLLQRPIYTATTRLQIEQNTPKILPFQDVMASVPDYRNDFYQTQYGLIQSRRVAREAIDSLHLADLEEFRIGLTPPAATGTAPEEQAEARRIDRFLKKLTVTPVRNSRLVDIAFSSHDRVLAAKVANRVADTYIAFNSQAQYNTTERATTSLTHQIANLQDEIDVKEKKLQAYARDNQIVALSDKQNIALKKLNDLSDSYTRAQAERIAKEARYAALRDASPVDLPEVLDSRLIQDLATKYAELTRQQAELSQKFKADWPEMVRLRRQIEETEDRLETERKGIYEQVLGAAESAYRSAKNQEQYLKSALDEQKRLSQEANLKEIDYNNLKAEITNQRSTLEALVKRQSETSSSAGLNDLVASNVRIVDIAEVPNRPSSPKIGLNILLSLVTGLGLGIGLAFFFEYLDKSVKTPEEILQAGGIPAIGMVPALRADGIGLRVIRAEGADGARRRGPVVELISHEDGKSKISEAFREVRTALLVSQPGGPPKTILITSALPGEGKTAVAINLAITLAQIGRRVLLVDADLRRPRIHKIFQIPNVQGLSTCLSASGVAWPEPFKSPIPRLDLIPSGPMPPNPADLLDSDRFGQVQHEVQERGYDHIIFDSPPVLPVADPVIMAARVDAVALVVLAGVTSRDALAHVVRRLQQVKARTVGAILNRADLAAQPYYYGYSYKRYYYGDEEKPQAPSADSPEPRRDRTIQI
ncbi:MAG TPA: polysaccharide biosynthesis tyrosine autokinase [Candidatus Polarisedimenticolia bacterium]|nr:polysaccharide biosynthesis tyrosine autokinase [Candidatus Polarisedimenticolia bacterium]